MPPIDRRHFLLGSAALAATPALAAAPADAPDAAVARRLVDAINDPATDAAMLRDLFAPHLLERQPAAAWLADFARWRSAAGGLQYRSIHALKPRERLVTVVTNRGREARLTMGFDAAHPNRVDQLALIPRPAPYPHPLVAAPVGRRALAEAIDRRVRWSAARDEFSGAVRVVAPDGAVVYERAIGRSEGRPLTPAHRFHLGSADKSFTALLVAGQVARGRLGFDTRLIEVLPDYPNADAARAITIGQLLSHRAGLGGLFERPGWNGGKQPYDRVADLLPIFAKEPLAFAPGTRADYSNEGFVVLGAVLERVDGRAYWDQLAAGVYAPAGMTRSAHLTAAQNPPDKAIGARYAEDDDLGLGGRLSARDFSGWRGNSCGGGYATVADMTTYLRALRAGRLADAAMLDRLTTPVEGGLPGYGMGVQNRELGGRHFVGHSGGGPHSGIDGDSAIVWETGWAISVLGNYDAPFAGALSYDLKSMLAAQPA